MAKRRGQNEGSIYQMKDGRWRSAVTIGWKNGRYRRKTFTAKTRREVADRLTKALRDQQQGLPVEPNRLTVGQFLGLWLESTKNSVRPKSYIFYESIVRLHLKPELGSIRLQKLTPERVQGLLNAKMEQGLSPRMVRHIRTTLVTALQQQVDRGNLPRNVASLADPPRLPKAEMQFFSVEQARAFIEASKPDSLHALFAVILALALRLGEGLGVSWDDVDFDAGRLTIRRALQRVKGRIGLVETKSDSSRRTTVLPAIAVAALHHQRARQQQQRQLAGTLWKGNPDNLVFTSKVGTPVEPRNALRRFQAILAGAGLPKMRLHDLRHSAVALLLGQGVSARAISELLGHSSVAFTLQVYGHLLEETKRETATKMDSALTVLESPIVTQVPREVIH
jgi:integrase